MTYFPDGSRYGYLADSEEGEGINVAWLAADHTFPMGPCTEGFVDALCELIRSSVNQTKGFHHCTLCSSEMAADSTRATVGGEVLHLGHAEIWVGSDSGNRFAAPTMVLHYVLTHEYQPPDAFQQAVIAAVCGPVA